MHPPRATGSTVRSVVLVAVALLALASFTHSWRFAWFSAAFVALYLAGDRAPGRVVAAVPGAAVLAWRASPVLQSWARWLLVAVVLAAAVATVDLERRWTRTGALPVLGLLAVGGVYACVPETGHVRFVASVFAVLAAAELAARQRTGPGLVLAATALVAWAVVHGGTHRPGALVGGFAALGLLLVEPPARRLPGPRRPLVRPALGRLAAMIVLQAGFALLVSRTAGLRDEAGAALVLAAPMLAGLMVAARLVLGPARGSIR